MLRVNNIFNSSTKDTGIRLNSDCKTYWPKPKPNLPCLSSLAAIASSTSTCASCPHQGCERTSVFLVAIGITMGR